MDLVKQLAGTESWLCKYLAERHGIAFAVTTTDGTIVAANSLFQTWAGDQAWTEQPDDLTGQNLTDVLPELAGWTGSVFSLTLRIPKINRQLADKTERYFDLQLEPLPNTTEVCLATLIDVTSEARLQQAIIHERNELRLSLEQSKRLEREQQLLIQELDTFAEMVAHDLKTPLSSVIGYASLLKKSMRNISDINLRQGLNVIHRSGHTMNAMINEILLLARVRQTEVEYQPLDMAKILDRVLERLHLMIDDGHVEIIQPSTWPAAIGHAPWVEEVWANYLSNGLKYGGPMARLELGATIQPDSMVRFWISDNGPGLTQEEQAKLFLPFTRLGNDDEQGHGLGLAIVKRIVTKLGGQVGVSSRVGQGSTFSFTLPLLHAMVEQPEGEQLSSVPVG